MRDETNWPEHILNGQTWLRFLVMLLYTPLLACVGFLIVCIALFQFFAMLASGESNAELRALGGDLSQFGVGIVDFLTCNAERRPFPFAASSPAPSVETTAAMSGTEARGGEQSSPRSSARRAPRRKSGTARKRASRKKKTATRRRAAPPRKQSGTRNTDATAAPPERDAPATTHFVPVPPDAAREDEEGVSPGEVSGVRKSGSLPERGSGVEE
jgi:hypothetical protein